MKTKLIGVSPAYFISRFSDRFRADQMAEGLIQLAALGFTSFQPEVFHREYLADWRQQGAARVAHQAEDLGLQASQFVAHFMLPAFADPENLAADWALADMAVVLEIVAHFNDCQAVTVPLGPFQAPPAPRSEDYRLYFGQCVEKIGRLEELVAETGRRLALEIMPGAVIGGIDGFLRLAESLGSEALGLNFDTGHAWAAKENLYLVPAKLGPRLAGTHLCDNQTHANLSLGPGTGSIDWPRLIKALRAVGYQGPYDLEIICPTEDCADEYRRGRDFIARLVHEHNVAA